VDDARSSPLEAPTPHHLLDGFLKARARFVPEDVLERDREGIEWFRDCLVSRDSAGVGVFPADELAARRVDRDGPTPHDLRAARGLVLDIRTAIAAGGSLSKPAPQGTRLVLRMLSRWMLARELINTSESRLIDEAAHRPPLPARCRPERRLRGRIDADRAQRGA
jgi:hypothetical protein